MSPAALQLLPQRFQPLQTFPGGPSAAEASLWSQTKTDKVSAPPALPSATSADRESAFERTLGRKHAERAEHHERRDKKAHELKSKADADDPAVPAKRRKHTPESEATPSDRTEKAQSRQERPQANGDKGDAANAEQNQQTEPPEREDALQSPESSDVLGVPDQSIEQAPQVEGLEEKKKPEVEKNSTGETASAPTPASTDAKPQVQPQPPSIAAQVPQTLGSEKSSEPRAQTAEHTNATDQARASQSVAGLVESQIADAASGSIGSISGILARGGASPHQKFAFFGRPAPTQAGAAAAGSQSREEGTDDADPAAGDQAKVAGFFTPTGQFPAADVQASMPGHEASTPSSSQPAQITPAPASVGTTSDPRPAAAQPQAPSMPTTRTAASALPVPLDPAAIAKPDPVDESAKPAPSLTSAPVLGIPSRATTASDRPTAHVPQSDGTPSPQFQRLLESQIQTGVAGAIQQSMSGTGVGAVTLRLHPANLGMLRVHIKMGESGSGVRARFEVSSGKTKSVLDGSIDALRSALEDRGLKVDEVVVAQMPRMPERELGLPPLPHAHDAPAGLAQQGGDSGMGFAGHGQDSALGAGSGGAPGNATAESVGSVEDMAAFGAVGHSGLPLMVDALGRIRVNALV